MTLSNKLPTSDEPVFICTTKYLQDIGRNRTVTLRAGAILVGKIVKVAGDKEAAFDFKYKKDRDIELYSSYANDRFRLAYKNERKLCCNLY